ncbi:tRNA glutamyl-Q(34) synthetase GluQRS [Rhizobium giardinii]|uniref:Glutamyl-Q tRNA(Asp) synthetase n=1 Tax=Rhizobium giardinii TaxID=56731 RepID=A0A7W8UAF6_9HYPH|nr:tRNA glutamyl-Q(34) synthetase GluQRS [Rhizobium giardinii]MBB5535179.1 glutamyl-Q tRNA(Asp) synthetase [Rhizobium giardinii]
MNAPLPKQPVFRFAPSPNGQLHLGHALSAILNHDMAKATSGRFLLRIEDIDLTRCTPEFEAGIFDDLGWLGLSWETPVRRQSEHLDLYRQALGRLIDRGLVYPAFLTRGAIKTAVAALEAKGKAWPRDPDGAPLYPGEERKLSAAGWQRMLAGGKPHAWRLDMDKAIAELDAPLTWQETGAGPNGETGQITADPAAWGDVVLSRSDAPSSYHLAVTMDDALQGVTHVVRGRDLYHATAVHRLLQRLLDLPEPVYHHHRLIPGPDGRKLSKSNKDTGIAAFREAGKTPDDVRALIL